MVKRDYRQLAKEAARAAAEKKAAPAQLFDVREQSDIADYVVIAGAESSVQMRAIEGAVEEAMNARGLRRLRREGGPAGRWVALDYGGFVMHVLLPEAREFYRLESMWEQPREIAWEEPEPRPGRAARAEKRKRA